MKFQTLQEAEEYYMGHYAFTNNAHDEEEGRMELWLESQEIEETKNT